MLQHVRWNLLELAACGMMLAGAYSFCTSAKREQHVTTAALCGLADVLATMNLLGFLRTGRRHGKNIRMLIGIVGDIVPFLEVQLVFTLGFTMAFAIMLPDQPRFKLPIALLTSYDMMLGVWDLEQFEGSHADESGWVLTGSHDDSCGDVRSVSNRCACCGDEVSLWTSSPPPLPRLPPRVQHAACQALRLHGTFLIACMLTNNTCPFFNSQPSDRASQQTLRKGS